MTSLVGFRHLTFAVGIVLSNFTSSVCFAQINADSDLGRAIKKLPNKISLPEKNKKADALVQKNEAHHGSRSTFLGLGLALGSSATYGNGLILNVDPIPYLRAQVGAGYNTTGAKTGAAAAAVLPVASIFGFDAGVAVVHSFGTKGEVGVSAKFTPEGSSSSENVTAIRKYRVAPANYYSAFLGPYFALTPNIWIEAHVNYNKVIAGNDVDFYDSVSFDTPIEPTNEDDVNRDFNVKAKKKLDINGLGFFVGVQLRI